MTRLISYGILLALSLSWPFQSAVAQETHTVRFPSGTTGMTVHGSLRGDNHIDYRLSVASGQVMSVNLKPESVYFNVLPPGSDNEAIFIGSRDGSAFSGTLSVGGTYIVRVYQMGAAASENRTREFTIEIAAK